MANIGTFTINKENGYTKFEDTIKEKYPDFVFEIGKTYTLGIENTCRFCVKGQKPDEREGFLFNSPNTLAYTHQEDSLWILAIGNSVKINIAE